MDRPDGLRGTIGTNAGQRWLKLGIAAALGVVAGAVLFPTAAQGRPCEGRGGGTDRKNRCGGGRASRTAR